MHTRLKSYINQTLRPFYQLSSDYEILEGTPIWILPVEGRSELSYKLRDSNFSDIIREIYGTSPGIEYYDEAIHVYLPEFIEGPISLSEHVGRGKHIYLFGEKHYSKERCGSKKISQFLKEMVQGKYVDLFLEAPYESPLPETSNDDIDDILITLRKDVYPNLKVHYSDMRTGDQSTEFSKLVARIHQNSDNIGAWEELVYIFKAAPEDLLNLVITRSDIQGKLTQQLQEADPAIINYYRGRLPDINSFIREIEEYLEVLRRGYANTGTSNRLGKKLIEIHSVILDLYLLTQMFRSSENIIIYVGDAHAEAMRGFFQEYALTEIQKTSSETSCIDISGFKKPFW